jgi:GNAT superfamily N-acetyltransferase
MLELNAAQPTTYSCAQLRYLDIQLIHSFLSQSYWSPNVPLATVEKAVRNSICVGAYTPTLQVGFARMVTDRATFGYLADVFVLEGHRGQGLCRLMLDALLGHCDLQGLRRLMLATRDAHNLYEKFGFRALKSPDRFMEKHNPNVYLKLSSPPPDCVAR